MIRYFLYLMLMNMLVNVIVFVPRILIGERYDGAVMAIVIGVPLSVVLLFFYSNGILKFPGQGLPEIIYKHTPKWFATPFLLLMVSLWFYAGWFLLLAFSDVTRKFVNPEITENMLITVFLLVVCMGVLLKSEKVLFALEIVFIFSVPFITLIFIKAYTNAYLNWDAIRVVLTHYKELPSLQSLGAITFTLYGFFNIAIYNRVFKGEIKKINMWWAIIFIVIGYVNAFTSVFIPIGFNGTNGVVDFIFPWVSTADSMRMELGFVERVVFILLLLYLGASLMMVIVIWHVGLELLKSVLPTQKLKGKKKKYLPLGIFILIAIITFITQAIVETKQLLELTKLYYALLIPIGTFTTILVSVIARRAKNEA